MKCQHCGINFEDGERFCPICGARAGSKGRLSETGKTLFPHKTVRPKAEKKTERESVRSAIDPQYESVRTTAQHKTHSHEARPIGKKAVPSAMPKKSGRTKGSRKMAPIIVAIVVLLNLAPMIIESIEDSVSNIPDFVYDFTDGGDSSYDESEPYAGLSDVIGTENEIALADGTQMQLSVEPGEDGDYTLSYTTPEGGTYAESGWTWCSKEDDSWYDEDSFPTENYEFYMVALTKSDENADSTAVPTWYDARGDSDLWLCVYRSRTDGSIILQDMDQIGLFGDTDIYELNPSTLI